MKKPHAILCDLDGTLALLSERSPYDASRALEDTLNDPIGNILEVYTHQTIYDVKVILLSGREEKYRTQTEAWLTKHKIVYEKLYLRQTSDRRPDTVVKKEIFEKEIKPKFDVLFVLEDRDKVVKMWREEGLTCLQVDYGDF